MKCMHCGSLDFQMLSSRIAVGGLRKRRYECHMCGRRWTHYISGTATATVGEGTNRIARAIALVQAGML